MLIPPSYGEGVSSIVSLLFGRLVHGMHRYMVWTCTNKQTINQFAYHWHPLTTVYPIWQHPSWSFHRLPWRSMPRTTRVVVRSVRRDFTWPACCSLDVCQETAIFVSTEFKEVSVVEKDCYVAKEQVQNGVCQCFICFIDNVGVSVFHMLTMLFPSCPRLFHVVFHVVSSCLQDCFACAVCPGNGCWPSALCWPYPACCGNQDLVSLRKVQNMSMDSVSGFQHGDLKHLVKG